MWALRTLRHNCAVSALAKAAERLARGWRLKRAFDAWDEAVQAQIQREREAERAVEAKAQGRLARQAWGRWLAVGPGRASPEPQKRARTKRNA